MRTVFPANVKKGRPGREAGGIRLERIREARFKPLGSF